jgi:LPXTG-motif cell wall-anchored protein
MKLSLKTVKMGLSSLIITGMLMLPTAAFATNGNGNGDLKEILQAVTTNGNHENEHEGDDDWKEHKKADLVFVKALSNKDGKIRFECVNFGNEKVKMNYGLSGSLKKEIELAAHETKVLEFDSSVKSFLDIWINGIAKASVESFTNAALNAYIKADLVEVKPLQAKVDGKIRFLFVNNDDEPALVTYVLTGINAKQQLGLAAHESRVVELDSKLTAALTVWVNEVAKAPVTAYVYTAANAQIDAKSITVKPLLARVAGKIRLQLVNSSSIPVTLKYGWAGTTVTKEIDLAGNETRIIEIDASDKTSLEFWVNQLTLTPITVITTPTVQVNADQVVVSALPQLTVGKVRYHFENKANVPVIITYAVAGVDLKKEIELAANESKDIEIDVTGKPSLNLWVNDVARTPVLASVDLGAVNPGSGTLIPTPGATPEPGTSVSDSSSGAPQDNNSTPTPTVTPGQTAVNGVNGSQPGSGVLSPADGTISAGAGAQPVAGYDSLPQTGQQIPWFYYLIGSLMMLLGALGVFKVRRNQ